MDPFETATLERLDRQESLKFLLRLKRERPDDVILPKQFHYSMESVPLESETGEQIKDEEFSVVQDIDEVNFN